jgi:hypothetical protein
MVAGALPTVGTFDRPEYRRLRGCRTRKPSASSPKVQHWSGWVGLLGNGGVNLTHPRVKVGYHVGL